MMHCVSSIRTVTPILKTRNDTRITVVSCLIRSRLPGRSARGNPEKIGEIIFVEELVRRHHRWWMHDPDNKNAYDKKFCEYINSVIRELSDRGEIIEPESEQNQSAIAVAPLSHSVGNGGANQARGG